MFLLLLIIVFVFLKKVDKRSLAYYFALIVLISLIGNLFIKDNYIVDLSDILHVLWQILVLGLLIVPWRSYKGINHITCQDQGKLKTVTIILIIFFMIMLIGCAVLAYYVMTQIEDINRFKYHDGTTDFYYSLGISLTPFMLASIFSPMSYIMVPLHMYYLSKGEKTLSFLCFVVSLLSVVYGLTYFSRAHLVHYILIYLCSYWLLNNTLSEHIVKALKRFMVIGAGIVVTYFLFISVSRFEGHDYSTHSGTTISNSTVINSIFDYLVMWWNNSEVLFSRFDWNTLHGQIAMQNVNRLFSLVGLNIGTTGDALMRQREALLGEYAGSFIGVGEYFLYDFGPFVSVILLTIYFRIVNSFRPRRGAISVENLLMISLLALLPTFAIFYSVLDAVLVSFIFITPIVIFLKSKT